MTFTIFALLS